ncbi:MAG: metallophosphoesterase [Oscillospiraceae bacterium]|jgi:predicted phosphodiesterase|nr:metallophosphoesterase [Oscillospiraceae bacterium]
MWCEQVLQFFAFVRGAALSLFVGLGWLPNRLRTEPTVFVAEDGYQIVWETARKSTARVTVGGVRYTDHLAGNIRWDQKVHKVEVPFCALDAAGGYEIQYRHMIVRIEGYKFLQGKEIRKAYAFRPVDFTDGLQIYNISDNHSLLRPADQVAAYWGEKLDLLILNGDIISDVDSRGQLRGVLELAAAVTHGTRPVLYTRGNHETRSNYALELSRWVGTPGADRYYFTTRLGALWLAVFDAGEDKQDGHAEYSGLADFDAYRAKETAYFERVVANAANEYDAPGVEYRLLVVHIPLGDVSATQRKWVELANQMKIDVALTGHEHLLAYYPAGGCAGQNYPLLIGARPLRARKDGSCTATALEFLNGGITAWFTGVDHQVEQEIKIKE